METLEKIWMNGKFVDWGKANIHVLSHGLHYGLAIFEGMRCYDTAIGPAVFRMKDHYKRFLNGCKSYHFKMGYNVEELSNITKELIRKNKIRECYIRPIVFTGYDRIGLDMRGIPFDFAICAVPFGKYYGDKADKGIKCTISSWRRMKGSVMSPHVKSSSNYLNSVLARREATDSGYDEAIMLIEGGHVAEGTGENLFIVRDGKLFTPPAYDGILTGITRESIISIAKKENIEIYERSMLRDELYTADEVFLCGTAAEVTHVRQIDHRKIGKSGSAGPITKRIKSIFFSAARGEDDRFREWLEPVD